MMEKSRNFYLFKNKSKTFFSITWWLKKTFYQKFENERKLYLESFLIDYIVKFRKQLL